MSSATVFTVPVCESVSDVLVVTFTLKDCLVFFVGYQVSLSKINQSINQ